MALDWLIQKAGGPLNTAMSHRMVTDCLFHSRRETIFNCSKNALTLGRKVFSEPLFNHVNPILREAVKSFSVGI